MGYEISDVQAALCDAVDSVAGAGQSRACFDGGSAVDRALWSHLTKLGFLGSSVAVDFGGVGGSFKDETLVAERLGYHTAALPYTTASVLCFILAELGDPAKDLLVETIGGSKVATAAISASRELDLGIIAEASGDQHWQLSGGVDDLLEGAGVDALVIPVERDAAVDWFALDAVAAGVHVTDQPSLDATQRLGSLTCSRAPATRLGSCSAAVARAALQRARVLSAANAAGAAARALDLSVAYAKQRHQFGQPIGRFQAVKHQLADMLINLENAKSAVYNGAEAIDGDRHDRVLAVLMAKAVATENAVAVVHAAIQVHGGIGFTWEHDLHLLLRRAKSMQLVLGDPDVHFDAIGAALFAQRSERSSEVQRSKAETLSAIVDETGDHEFLAEFSSWLDANLPSGWGTPDYQLPRDPAEQRAALIELQRTLAGGRWIGIHWPARFGGRDATLAQQVAYHAELTRRGIPQLPGHRGITIVGPTLIKHATPEQQARFIDRIRTGDDLWAGGFSEPEAGSDLASLRTRGVIDGDEICINGSKIWTSSARWCNWIYTLVRTNSEKPKHQGISVVLVPLDHPGITVRPIRQITGAADFNEVFFDHVHVPVDHIVGPVGDGWRVNRTTLSHEHSTLFIGAQARYARSVDAIIDGVLRRETNAESPAALRHRNQLARHWAISQLMLVNGMRNVARVQAEGQPGPEGSIMKVFGQESEKALFELAFDLVGPKAVLDRRADGVPDRGKWLFGYLGSRAATIGGGTSEIHRNKIGENVLGLPRDLWADEA
jgi:alkylation response protein AidB-like acyl-CoA dehydrogenase